MRMHEVVGRQLDFEAFLTPETRPVPRATAGATLAMHVYGDDFALVRVRDGFYADDRRVFYVSRGRVYLVRSPRMRPGQGFRRIAGLPVDARGVDEASFDPDDAGDQALFAVADCIDGIH